MGANSGGVSWATSICGGWYCCIIMLFGRVAALLSARARDGVLVPGLGGTVGESLERDSSLASEPCGVVVSIGAGCRFGVCSTSCDFEDLGEVTAGSDDHAVMKLRTVQQGQSCGIANIPDSPLGGGKHEEAVGVVAVVYKPRGRGMV
jgi:hypothetical protein